MSASSIEKQIQRDYRQLVFEKKYSALNWYYSQNKNLKNPKWLYLQSISIAKL